MTTRGGRRAAGRGPTARRVGCRPTSPAGSGGRDQLHLPERLARVVELGLVDHGAGNQVRRAAALLLLVGVPVVALAARLAAARIAAARIAAPRVAVVRGVHVTVLAVAADLGRARDGARLGGLAVGQEDGQEPGARVEALHRSLDLVAVLHPVAIGVGVVGVVPHLDLGAVPQAVAVGVGLPRVGLVLELLLVVEAVVVLV